MDKAEIERKIENIYRSFMEAYYLRHDLEGSLSFLHPQFSAIGTGKDERVEGIEEAKRLFMRDFKQAPNPVYVHYHFIKPILLSKDTCMVISSYRLNTTIEGIPLDLNSIRSSMVFTKYENTWKIIHSHISFPFIMQKEGESFPLFALKQKNRLLQVIIKEKIEEIGNLMEELERLASFDRITEIYNRNKFEDILTYELKKAERYGYSLSILMIDIDHFKEINDTLGHLTGDKILRSIAKLILSMVRKTDVFARWGGDEFVILSPSTDLPGAKTLGEKIRKRVEEYDFGIGKTVTISIGITNKKEDDDIISLIQRVDKLLYKAKNSGRNTIKVA